MTQVIHEPGLATIAMVEKAILDSQDYPTKTALWRALPRKVQYQTFKRVLDYLEASGQIAFDEDHRNVIIFTGPNNKKLRDLLASAVPIDP